MPKFNVCASMLVLGLSTGFCCESSHAQAAAATTGCPQFHCTPEATGAMSQPIVGDQDVTTNTSSFGFNPPLGTLYAQGCSGDGTRLACLVGDSTSGTLKLVDTTVRPMSILASDALSSKPLGSTWFHGQVPFIFSDGRVGAGDADSYNIYSFVGSPTPSLVLQSTAGLLPQAPPGATTVGLTDLGNGYGVVARTDGVLTFINMGSGAVVPSASGSSSLQLKGANNGAVTLASPPSASDGVLYVAANSDANPSAGYLYAISMSGSDAPATWTWRYAYVGKTGASPVEATSVATGGYSKTLVLLHVPGTNPPTTSQLLGILDNGLTATKRWYIPLVEDLVVAPSVDEVNHLLYLIYKDDYQVFGYPLYVAAPAPASNAVFANYDLQSLSGLSMLKLNGHIGAAQTGVASDFKLLLAGVGKAWSGAPNAQYMIVLQPTPTSPTSPSAWKRLVSVKPANYTAAWNLSPADPSGNNPGLYCPLVVEGGPPSANLSNGLVLMCDY